MAENMSCISHNDRNAIVACAKCGVGLCNECESNSVFRSDNNQANCKRCNYEQATASVRKLESDLCEIGADIKGERNNLRFLLVTLSFGLIALLVSLIMGSAGLGFVFMWLLLGFGFFIFCIIFGTAKRIIQGDDSFGTKIWSLTIGPFIFGPVFVPREIFKHLKGIRESKKLFCEYEKLLEDYNVIVSKLEADENQ